VLAIIVDKMCVRSFIGAEGLNEIKSNDIMRVVIAINNDQIKLHPRIDWE